MEKDGDASVPATTIHPGFGRHDPACVYAVQNLEGRMPDDQWKVLYHAASVAQHNGGIFYCSRDYLAKQSGVSRSTAVRALAWAAEEVRSSKFQTTREASTPRNQGPRAASSLPRGVGLGSDTATTSAITPRVGRGTSCRRSCYDTGASGRPAGRTTLP